MPGTARSRTKVGYRFGSESQVLLEDKARSSGYALSVFRGQKIERFNVNLIGEYPDGGLAGIDLIMGRASGPAVEAIGSVPFGTSGSPVVVEGRVIGAISTLFPPDPTLVGITPWSAMRSIGEIGSRRGASGHCCSGLGQSKAFASNAASGFTSPEALKALENHLGSKVSTLGGDGNSATVKSGTLKPGSPIGVLLMAGDLSIGAIGTVTMIKGDGLWAFGHPFRFWGPVELPLTRANIVTTTRGDFSYKLGTFGDIVGTVTQDRAAGLFARLGAGPDNLVPITYTITDDDRRVTSQLKVQTVPIPSELRFLAYLGSIEAFARALDRVGAGTATWEWVVHTSGGGTIRQKDTKYDPYDIGALVSVQIITLLEQPLQEGVIVKSIELTAGVRFDGTSTVAEQFLKSSE